MARRQAVRAGVLIALLLGSAGAIALALSARPAVQADSDDEVHIKNAIETSLTVMGAACVRGNHGQEATFKSQIAQYWSSVAPSGAALEQRWERYGQVFATPNPTDVAEHLAVGATLVAEGELDADRATAMAGHVEPTPFLVPEDSPLQERQREIDTCQSAFGTPGDFTSLSYHLDGVTYRVIRVAGNSAEAAADVTATIDWGYGPQESQLQMSFTLVRSSSSWLLVRWGITSRPW